MSVSFFVPGIPTPAGSKRAFVVKGRPVVTDTSGAKGKHWRAAVQLCAAEAFTQPFEGALALSVTFQLPRPAGHWNKAGNLRSSANGYPVVRPDTTKLVRALEDALTGIAWRDDAQIVIQVAIKEYVKGTPGVQVKVVPL